MCWLYCKWCSLPPPSPAPAERSMWVWEGLHRSHDHVWLLGLLHPDPRGGQQQESRRENQLWEIKTGAVSGPGPVQRVDPATRRPRYWNRNHLCCSASPAPRPLAAAFELPFVASGSLGGPGVESILGQCVVFFICAHYYDAQKGKIKSMAHETDRSPCCTSVVCFEGSMKELLYSEGSLKLTRPKM